MPDYSKGKIYKIECNLTNDVYYGSTTYKYLSSRLAKHKYSRKCSAKQIIDRGNFTCKVIEEFPCKSRQELETRERWYIENNQCINIIIPTRKIQEYNKKFTCDCGGKYSYFNRERHCTTKKHLDYVTNK